MNLITVIDRSRPVFQRTACLEPEFVDQFNPRPTGGILPDGTRVGTLAVANRAGTQFIRVLAEGEQPRDALFIACHVVARSAQDMAEMMRITIPEVHQTCRRLGLNELP